MQILNKIAVSTTEPPSTDVLWIKPVKGGMALYIFDGFWKALEIVNTMGTATPDDDVPLDAANIPSMEGLDAKIEQEVTEQVADHDAKVHDTHNAPTGDSEEYPEVDDLFQ